MHIKTVDEGRHHRRELWLDDETQVAHLWVIDYTMRIGTAEVQMAGIGGVHTEREHRMKGYMRELFEDTVGYMTSEGYDVSMLFGIPNFYNKFGYATCLAQYRVSIKTRDAEDAATLALALKPRPVTADDMSRIVALSTADNATRSGSVLRDPEAFKGFSHGTDWETRTEAVLWEDAAGNLLGYLVTDRERTAVTVAELAAKDRTFFPTMLTYLAQQAVEKRCESIAAVIPSDHAFAEYLQRFGCEWKIRYPRYSDGMMRIMNQPELFEKIASELARRVTWAQNPTALALQTDLGDLTLVPDGDTFRIEEGTQADARLALSQDKLMQLVMGYRSVADVLNSPDVTLTGDARPALEALFPKDVAFVWSPDHF